MSILSLIPRRLDAGSCITVGTQVDTTIKDWKSSNNQAALPTLLDNKAALFLQSSKELETLDKDESSMGEIDQLVDSCVSAWNNLPALLQELLQGDEHLPYLDTEKSYLNALQKIQATSLPEGTEIIRLPFRRQWRSMQKIKKALLGLQTELEATGLTLFSARIIRWIDLYGAKLGITETNDEPTELVAAALEKWHRTLAEVLFTLLSYEMQPDHPDLAAFPGLKIQELRDLFVTPYELQADIERREVRERRERSKKKQEES